MGRKCKETKHQHLLVRGNTKVLGKRLLGRSEHQGAETALRKGLHLLRNDFHVISRNVYFIKINKKDTIQN